MSAGGDRPGADSAAGSAADPVGLDELERRVHAAAARLRELSAENARLAGRVAELEAAAEEARQRSSGSEPAESEPAGAVAEWRREREEVRRRVEKLARRLSELLGDDA